MSDNVVYAASALFMATAGAEREDPEPSSYALYALTIARTSLAEMPPSRTG
jgi:hypothetical protein